MKLKFTQLKNNIIKNSENDKIIKKIINNKKPVKIKTNNNKSKTIKNIKITDQKKRSKNTQKLNTIKTNHNINQNNNINNIIIKKSTKSLQNTRNKRTQITKQNSISNNSKSQIRTTITIENNKKIDKKLLLIPQNNNKINNSNIKIKRKRDIEFHPVLSPPPPIVNPSKILNLKSLKSKMEEEKAKNNDIAAATNSGTKNVVSNPQSAKLLANEKKDEKIVTPSAKEIAEEAKQLERADTKNVEKIKITENAKTLPVKSLTVAPTKIVATNIPMGGNKKIHTKVSSSASIHGGNSNNPDGVDSVDMSENTDTSSKFTTIADVPVETVVVYLAPFVALSLFVMVMWVFKRKRSTSGRVGSILTKMKKTSSLSGINSFSMTSTINQIQVENSLSLCDNSELSDEKLYNLGNNNSDETSINEIESISSQSRRSSSNNNNGEDFDIPVYDLGDTTTTNSSKSNNKNSRNSGSENTISLLKNNKNHSINKSGRRKSIFDAIFSRKKKQRSSRKNNINDINKPISVLVLENQTELPILESTQFSNMDRDEINNNEDENDIDMDDINDNNNFKNNNNDTSKLNIQKPSSLIPNKTQKNIKYYNHNQPHLISTVTTTTSSTSDATLQGTNGSNNTMLNSNNSSPSCETYSRNSSLHAMKHLNINNNNNNNNNERRNRNSNNSIGKNNNNNKNNSNRRRSKEDGNNGDNNGNGEEGVERSESGRTMTMNTTTTLPFSAESEQTMITSGNENLTTSKSPQSQHQTTTNTATITFNNQKIDDYFKNKNKNKNNEKISSYKTTFKQNINQANKIPKGYKDTLKSNQHKNSFINEQELFAYKVW